MGILRILFLLICVTFPFGVLIRISFTPQAHIYPVDLAVVLFVLVGVYLSLGKKDFSKWLYPFSFFVLAAAISLIINMYWLSAREGIIASLYLIRFCMYLLLIPIVSTQFKKKDVGFLMTSIVLSLFSTVILGILQYFLYPDLRNLMYLGWDEHLYRIFSSFLDPNFASVIFVICFWLIVSLIRKQKKKSVWTYVLGAMSVLTFLAILFTYSRTGYLSFGVSAVLFFLIEKKYKLLLIILGLFIVGILAIPKNYQSEGVNLLRTASVYSRLESFQTAQTIIIENPILGVGFNAYRYAQERYTDEPNLTISHAGAGVSNSYLFVLATTGIVGFTAFIYAITRLVNELRKILKKDQVFGSTIIAVFGGILAGSFVENIFFYSFVLIALFILLGIGRIIKDDK